MSVPDPLADLPLPPGDPGALRSTARSLVQSGSQLDDSGRRQQQAVNAVSGSAWTGVASESARGATGKVLSAYQEGSTLADNAAAALNTCASSWEAAQGDYQSARQLADQAMAGEAVLAQANQAMVCLANPPDPGPIAARAQAMARDAISQFNAASRKMVGQIDTLSGDVIKSPAFLPQPVHHWWDTPLHWGDEAIDAIGHGLADAWSFVANNPGQIAKAGLDLLGMTASAALVAVSATGDGAGFVLDATGVGAVVGVPVNVLSTAGVVAGAGGTIYFAHGLGQDISNMESRGVDRGDGRDEAGHFTGGSGYGAPEESQGLDDYTEATGRPVIDQQVRATLPDGSIRYYDGLSQNPDGTWQGVEVKSNSASLSTGQRAFDNQVNDGTPAVAKLNGVEIKITSAVKVTVESK